MLVMYMERSDKTSGKAKCPGLMIVMYMVLMQKKDSNTYSVAMIVGTLPRAAGHARTSGLYNLNSYRVAKDVCYPFVTSSTVCVFS